MTKKVLNYIKRSFLLKTRLLFCNRLTIPFEDLVLHYALDSPVSKQWFFPIYAKGSVHEPAVSALIYSHLRANSTFLDIGAHIGFFTVLAGQICNGPSGSVHAFEVDPSLIPLIAKSVALNSDVGKIFITCAAVTDTGGDYMAFSPHQFGNPSTNQLIIKNDKTARDREDNPKIQTISVTVDDYVRTKALCPDLIKMDIEGAEALAVYGMLATLREKKPKILLEVHPKRMSIVKVMPEQVVSLILETGYEAWVVQEYRRGLGARSEPKLAPLKINEMSNERPTMLFFEPR